MVGGKLQDHPELAQTASPIPYVDSDDPPYLIVHGDSDPLVPYQQSEMLQEALEKSSVDSELVIVPGGGHGSFQKPEQVARVKKFFDLHLRQK